MYCTCREGREREKKGINTHIHMRIRIYIYSVLISTIQDNPHVRCAGQLVDLNEECRDGPNRRRTILVVRIRGEVEEEEEEIEERIITYR